jgi:hypothetical protein
MQKGEACRRLGNRHHAKEARKWASMGPGRPSPVQGSIPPSFDLATIRAIYSPGVESHASSNLPSVAKEQRREGHHPGEERVELVD